MSSNPKIDTTVSSQVPRLKYYDPVQTIEKDDVFHILQSSRRRLVLAYLREQNKEVTMRELSKQVAAWENNKPIHELTPDEKQRIYVSLYQGHLEKLEEHNIITYDRERGLIARTEAASRFDPYIDPPDNDRSSTHSRNPANQLITQRIMILFGIFLFLGGIAHLAL